MKDLSEMDTVDLLGPIRRKGRSWPIVLEQNGMIISFHQNGQVGFWPNDDSDDVRWLGGMDTIMLSWMLKMDEYK